MDPVAARLAEAGFVAAAEEAAELRAAGGDLEALVARRLTGEPLAWITGTTTFCGISVAVHPGVYVPRPQTEHIAERAAARLPDAGFAIDACCGCGAIGAVLRARRPRARVLALDRDPIAVANARANRLDAAQADLLEWPEAVGPPCAIDVVVAVVPYVPTGELALLHRDALAFEPRHAYDGGPDGLALARRLVAQAAQLLRPGGALVLELGGDQAEALELPGFEDRAVLRDEDGDVRGIEATRRRTPQMGG